MAITGFFLGATLGILLLLGGGCETISLTDDPQDPLTLDEGGIPQALAGYHWVRGTAFQYYECYGILLVSRAEERALVLFRSRGTERAKDDPAVAYAVLDAAGNVTARAGSPAVCQPTL